MSTETVIAEHMLPPAVYADPLGMLPASAEKISQETLANIPKTTDVVFEGATAEEIEQLEQEIDTKAAEIIGQFANRVEYELLPLLYKMKSILPHGEWTNWFERFRKRVKFTWTLRNVQRKFKELKEGWSADPNKGIDPLPNDDDPDDDPAPVVIEPPKEQVTKWVKQQRKVLLGGDGPIDADPIRGPERRIDTALRMLDDFELQIDEGLLDPVPQVASLRQVINRPQHSKLRVVPLHLREANAVVAKWHRHHSPIRVAKFSIGAMLDGELVGVCICMRPASRALDDGKTIEVARMAVVDDSEGVVDGTGTRHANSYCSFLYGAAARIAREMGYEKITTYILEEEPGISLRGAGWTLERRGCGGTVQGVRKGRPNGHKITPVTFMKKQRFAKVFPPTIEAIETVQM